MHNVPHCTLVPVTCVQVTVGKCMRVCARVCVCRDVKCSFCLKYPPLMLPRVLFGRVGSYSIVIQVQYIST